MECCETILFVFKINPLANLLFIQILLFSNVYQGHKAFHTIMKCRLMQKRPIIIFDYFVD